MEDAHQAEVVGIAEDVLVELHHRLLVATEEIDLDAANAVVLHPLHLLATDAGVVQLADRRLWSVVPRAVGVVPKEDAHAFLACVARQFCHTFVADLLVPKGIDEHALPTHGCREVDISLLLVEVTAWVHTDDPRPAALAVGVGLRSLVFLLYQVEWYCSLHDVGQRTYGDGAPRSAAGECHSWGCRADTVHFALLWEADGIRAALLIEQSATYITAVGARFADENPVVCRCAEQTGKRVSFAPTVLTRGIIEGIGGLVAGISACKAAHRLRLWAEECCGAFRQGETACFSLHYADTRLFLGKNRISECHVTIRHAECDVHCRLAVLFIANRSHRSHIFHMALLDVGQRIAIDHLLGLKILFNKPLCIVTDVRHQSQGRCFHHFLVLIGNLVMRPSFVRADCNHNLAIRTRNLIVGKDGERSHQGKA